MGRSRGSLPLVEIGNRVETRNLKKVKQRRSNDIILRVTNNGLAMRDCNEHGTKGSAMLDQSILDYIIQRIVEVAQPEKIILFGSAARGDMNRHSDVDLLIIKEGTHRGSLAGRIYENLDGVGAAVDVVVVTPTDVERYKDSHALVIKPALRAGRVVYESS